MSNLTNKVALVTGARAVSAPPLQRGSLPMARTWPSPT